jgi:hypothetical protein
MEDQQRTVISSTQMHIQTKVCPRGTSISMSVMLVSSCARKSSSTSRKSCTRRNGIYWNTTERRLLSNNIEMMGQSLLLASLRAPTSSPEVHVPLDEVIRHDRCAERPFGVKLVNSMFVLHSGSFFGFIGLVLMMAASLLMPLFAITGWQLYLQRRAKKRAARRPYLRLKVISFSGR